MRLIEKNASIQVKQQQKCCFTSHKVSPGSGSAGEDHVPYYPQWKALQTEKYFQYHTNHQDQQDHSEADTLLLQQSR
jgi:hypothetical protein